jgi:outer membrane protein assembly factor BamD
MPPKLTRTAALLLACAIVIPAAGCARNKTGSDTAYIARDVNSLYALAKQKLDKGQYEDAAKLFDEVERQHPYSVWARRAQLMSAFSYYMAQKYPEAISSAQRFLTIHPGNKDAPYAHYLIAMSHYQQIEDVTRDQRITQQASDSFNELIRRYPQSRYASDARLKLDLINDHLAGKEMEIGRFYQRSGKWLAATLRFRKVVEQYQTTNHTPEALERLVECYAALGIPEEARKSAAVLGANYPATFWYRQSLRILIRDRDHLGGRTAVSSYGGTPTASQPQAPKAATSPQGAKATSYPQPPKSTKE